jgi:hypothetical protein
MKYFFIVISLYVLLTKVIVNTHANPQGDFQASSAGYIVALITLLFISFIIFRYKSFFIFKNRFFVTIPMIYYGYALSTSAMSLLPIVSSFRSISGVGFILIGCTIGKYMNQYELKYRAYLYYRLLILITLVGIIANVIYGLNYINEFSIFKLQAGYVSLICIYIAIWHYIDYQHHRKKKDLLIFIFLVLFTVQLHSFSAYISLYIAFIFLFFYKKNYIKFLAALLLPVSMFTFAVKYLESNLDALILGKTAGSYLIGSGRFDVYIASFDAFSKLDLWYQIQGVGFMSERNILSEYSLAWSSDPHNSFIVSLLGLGVIGVIIYMTYIITPFLYRKKLAKIVGKELSLKWILLHVVFLVYGVTSSSYLAVPSMQLILFTVFSYILFHRRSIEIDYEK